MPIAKPRLLTCLAVGFALVGSTTAAATCYAQSNASPASVVLPLDRTTYVVGELVPLAIRSERAATMTLEPADGDLGTTVSVHEKAMGPMRLDTAQIAEGTYSIHLDGKATGVSLTLVSPLRPSAAAIIEEGVVPIRHEVTFNAVMNAATNAYFGMGTREAMSWKRPQPYDELLTKRLMTFPNPSTRQTSFKPPRAWDHEMDNWGMVLAQGTQKNLRYPNFGGVCYEWDAGEIMRNPSIFFRMGDMDEQWRAYQAKSNEAVVEQFREQTGLEPPTTKELIIYAAAIGRPEAGPALDMPSRKWMRMIAERLEPMPEEELTALGDRIAAWNWHLMTEYGRGHQRMSTQLKRIDPSMAHTGSVNLDHGTIAGGHYTPADYQGLDFRHMSAWNDQIGIGDYDFQWLYSAAMMNTDNPDNQPIWIATGTWGHQYGGKDVRTMAHILAHNGTGIGSAAEGHGSWAKARAGNPSLRSTEEFADRFVSLATQGEGDHKVAILFSRSQLAREVSFHNLGSPSWQALVTLTRLGYTPRFITEEQVLDGGLEGFEALTIWEQTIPLPDPVVAAIEAFAGRGGKVTVDASSTAEVPGATRLTGGIYVPKAKRQYGSGFSSTMLPMGMSQLSEYLHDNLAPAVLEGLGDTGRAIYRPAAGVDSDVTVMQIDGGQDATFAVMVNDSWNPESWSHTSWLQVQEDVAAAPGIGARAVRYDLNAEREAGAAAQGFTVDLTDTTARLFAVTTRPVATTDLRATQNLAAGEPLGIRIAFHDDSSQPLEAVLPFHLKVLRPDGSAAFSGYRATERDGVFAAAWTMPRNAPAGEWTVVARSQLTGHETTLTVTVRSAAPTRHAQAIDEPVIGRQTAAIEKLLSKEPQLTVPVFAGDHAAEHRRLAGLVAKTLAGKGVRVETRDDPKTGTYTLAYVWTDEQQRENDRIDAGEMIGVIEINAHRGEHYYTDDAKYRFGRHVVLLDLVQVKGDNPMAEVLDKQHMLWPEVDAAFPGSGRAVVQLIHDAFDPDHDAIVIQATDVEGLEAGIAALADLPTDWVGTSVSDARLALMKQWHIHGGVEPAARSDGLTAEGRRTHDAPQRFELAIGGKATPPTADQVEPAPKQHDYKHVAVPADLKFQRQAYAEQRSENGWVNASPGHKRKLPADLRFTEAIAIPVEVTEPGAYTVRTAGVFRYSDRQPRSQPNWEAILEIYEQVVKLPRKPLEWEMQLNDQAVGHLTPSKTEQASVPIDTLPFYMKTPPPSVTEEVVSELTGTVELTQGKHVIRLVLQNMVDGELTALEIKRAQ